MESSENQGTEVDPLFRSRFTAEARPREDLFRWLRRLDEATIVERLRDRHEVVTVYGRTESILHDGTWRVSFRLDSNPVGSSGVPKSAFEGSRIMEAGSSEETSFLDERRERLTQRWEEVLSASFSGSSAQRLLLGSRNHSVVIRFNEFDRDAGSFTGEIEWVNLGNARKAISGRRVGDLRVVFEETAWIGPVVPEVYFGLQYQLDLDPVEPRLRGEWAYRNIGSGTVDVSR